MGVIEFFVLVVVVVILAACAVWVISYFAPNAPPLIPKIIWGVAIIVIAVALANALGFPGNDPQIPRLR